MPPLRGVARLHPRHGLYGCDLKDFTSVAGDVADQRAKTLGNFGVPFPVVFRWVGLFG